MEKLFKLLSEMKTLNTKKNNKLDHHNLFSVENKNVLITGAGGLLGRVYTSSLLSAGASVIAIDKNKILDFDKKLNSEFGNDSQDLERLFTYKLDITSSDSVKKFFCEEIINEKWYKDGFDVLINNASLVKQVQKNNLTSAYSMFENQEKKDWDEYLQVDVVGALHMVQGVIPSMKKKANGVIINISSTYGNVAPDQRLYKSLVVDNKGTGIEKPIGYSVSKSAVLNMTRHLATLYAKNGIRVNTLTPGGVFDDNPKEFVNEYSNRTPLGRMADRMEYAGPILFLSSKASSYMTGANLVVDGGWTAW